MGRIRVSIAIFAICLFLFEQVTAMPFSDVKNHPDSVKPSLSKSVTANDEANSHQHAQLSHEHMASNVSDDEEHCHKSTHKKCSGCANCMDCGCVGSHCGTSFFMPVLGYAFAADIPVGIKSSYAISIASPYIKPFQRPPIFCQS